MAALRTLIRQPTHQLSAWNNILIANIEGDVDSRGVRELVDGYLTVSKNYPDGIAAITMLRASLKVGTSDTNAEAKRGMHELRHKVLHAAIVIEDQSMLASLLRAIIRTLNSISRRSVLSIAADLEEAVRTVTPHVKPAFDAPRSQVQTELMQAVMAVRNPPSRFPTQ